MTAVITKNINIEVSIRTSRILKVLDETIEKIELALCLPVFLKNIDRFSNHLTEYEIITLRKCEAHRSQDTKEIQAQQESIDEDEIKVLLSSDRLKESQHSSVERGAQHFSLQYEKPSTNGFEDSLTDDLSPEAERKKTLHYKDIWFKNDDAMTKINSLKPLLNDIKTHFEVELEGKNKLISDLQSCMKNLEIGFKEEIEKICYDYEKNMAVEIESSATREEIIVNDVRNLDETYQHTLNEHLKQEKESREKRLMIESELEKCLETYDNDMGERQAEYEDVLAEYEEEQRQLGSLQERFDEQEKEYIILMEEKAYEEHLELERRIEDLRRRVAARIIQIHWRTYKQRKLERAKSKKGRKAKGKKK